MKNLFTFIIIGIFFSILCVGSLHAAITSAATGNWNAGSTWVGGVVPSSSDDVTIEAGHTVTIDGDATVICANLTIAGTLQFANESSATFVTNDITINSGGIFRPVESATSSSELYVNINGNLTVNGTLTTIITTGSFSKKFGINMNGSGKVINSPDAIYFYNILIGTSTNITLEQDISVDVLALSSGNLNNETHNVTMKSGATIYRSEGTISAAPNFEGINHTIWYYNDVTTGPELPDVVGTIRVSASVTLNKNVETDELYLSIASNRLITNGNTIKVNNSFPEWAMKGYVIGNLAQPYSTTESKVFPIGSATAYRPVTVNVTSLTGSGNITVSQTDAAPACNSLPDGVSRISNARSWTITKDAAITAATADITLTWGDDDGVTTPANMTVVHGSCSTGAWDLHDHPGNTTGDASSGTITGTFSSFSDFTLGTIGIDPLPVELSSFSAIVNSNVELKWSTAAEVNNYGFEIQRLNPHPSPLPGVEEKGWVKIGFVNGGGSSNSQKNYSFVDQSSFGNGKYTYRLKQIDNNGAFKYSKEVEVEINKPTVFALGQNYPNPFNPSTTISFSIPEDNHVILKLYDVLGREVLTLINENRKAGTHTLSFNASSAGGGLSNGIYIYKIVAGNYSAVKKMLLLK